MDEVSLEIDNEQRSWLKTVRNKCKDISCLEKVYYKRISVMSPVDNSAKSLWEGSWGSNTEFAGNDLGIAGIEKISRTFDFSIEAFYRMNTGELQGTALFVGDYAVAIVQDEDMDLGEDVCRVEF